MTQREELSDDQKKLSWLLGLEKETLVYMAHQQSKIIEKSQKAAKAQAAPCPNVNEAINNPMPRGYMLNMLVKFQKWRIGEDVRTLDETGLTPRLITLAIDWAIEQLDKSKTQAAPEGWKLVPVEPTSDQFGGMARDIIQWMRFTESKNQHSDSLVKWIRDMGNEIPAWLYSESEINHLSKHVISKGTIAAIIYKAMLAAAPEQNK